MGDITQPATAPMPAESTKDRVTIFFVLMPHSVAALRFAAQARISRPSEVNLKNRLRPATMREQTPMTHSTWGEIRAPRMVTEVTSLPMKYGRARTLSPQICSAASRARIEIPMVIMIILSTDGLSSQRMKTISIKAPTTMVMSTAAVMARGMGIKAFMVMAVIPPSMTNSPWAKLIMPVVL
jgi:hypothetical protein